jgi:hypothetical protein
VIALRRSTALRRPHRGGTLSGETLPNDRNRCVGLWENLRGAEAIVVVTVPGWGHARGHPSSSKMQDRLLSMASGDDSKVTFPPTPRGSLLRAKGVAACQRRFPGCAVHARSTTPQASDSHASTDLAPTGVGTAPEYGLLGCRHRRRAETPLGPSRTPVNFPRGQRAPRFATGLQ